MSIHTFGNARPRRRQPRRLGGLGVVMSDTISIAGGFEISLTQICNYIATVQGYGAICDCERLVSMGNQQIDALVAGFMADIVSPVLGDIPTDCWDPNWADALTMAVSSISISSDGFDIDTSGLWDYAKAQLLCQLLSELKDQLFGPAIQNAVRDIRELLLQSCHSVAGTTSPTTSPTQPLVPTSAEVAQMQVYAAFLQSEEFAQLEREAAGRTPIVDSEKTSPVVWFAAAGVAAVALFAVSRRR